MLQFIQNISSTVCLLLISVSMWAQPDCPILISPSDGAVDVPLTITFSWEAAATGDVPTNYFVYAGTQSGNLTQIYAGPSTTTTVGSFFQMNTTYFWQVIAQSDGGLSDGCVEQTFTTIGVPVGPVINCGSSTPFMFINEMENNSGWTGDLGTDLAWSTTAGTTPSGNSGNTGPNSSHSGTSYFFFESSGSNSSTPDKSLISPAIPLTNVVGDINMAFFMYAHGNGIHSLEVGVGVSPTGPFDNIWTWEGPLQTTSNQNWQEVSFNLSDYQGETVYVEFKHVATASGGFLGDLALDEISVHGCAPLQAENNDCETATILAEGGNAGSLSNQTTEFATVSGFEAPFCGLPATKDIYYTIESDVNGGVIEVALTSGAAARYTMALYEGDCTGFDEVACASATNTGDNISLFYTDPNSANGGSSASRSANEVFILRIYDTNDANESFDLDASGSGLAQLPVELVNFEATLQAKSVDLSWKTAAEYNTDKFTVEKSLDGITWNAISEVAAVGFTSDLQSYSYTDRALNSVQMYRLKIQDFDGSYEYSQLVNIRRDDLQYSVYPNPVVDVLTIEGISNQQDVGIEIFDARGALILEKSNATNTINLSDLAPGIYQLRVISDTEIFIKSVIKQ